MVQFTSVVIWVPAAAWAIHQIAAADPNCQKSFNFGTENSHTDMKKWSLFVGIIEAQAILSQAFQVNFWSIEKNQKSSFFSSVASPRV